MRRWIAGVVGAGLLLAGCGVDKARVAESAPMPAADAMAGEAAPAPTEAPARAAGDTQPVALKSRKIVYTGQLNVECDQLEPTIEQARGIVEQAGGYISNLDQSGGALSREATLTFRIPAEKFDATMNALAKLGDVRQRSFSSSDVTDQWVDLDARVRNLKLEEQRLLAILAKAGDVSDLLEVERELARVRGEAEQIEGQLRRLNDQVALSTIELGLSLPPDKDATVESDSWLKSVIADSAASFVILGKGLIALAIRLLFLSPFIAIPVLFIRWLLKLRRRRRTESPRS